MVIHEEGERYIIPFLFKVGITIMSYRGTHRWGNQRFTCLRYIQSWGQMGTQELSQKGILIKILPWIALMQNWHQIKEVKSRRYRYKVLGQNHSLEWSEEQIKNGRNIWDFVQRELLLKLLKIPRSLSLWKNQILLCLTWDNTLKRDGQMYMENISMILHTATSWSCLTNMVLQKTKANIVLSLS